VPADSYGPLGLGGLSLFGPRTPARPPIPEPLEAPRAVVIPEQVTVPDEAEPLAPAAVDPDARLPRGFAKLAVHRGTDEHGR
jgi:hypothetical protein